MRRKVWVLGFGVAFLTIPGLAAAGYQYQTVTTWGWHAQMPVGWKLVGKVKTNEKKPHDGLWRYQSPNTHWRLRIGVHEMKKNSDFTTRVKNTYIRTYKRLPSLVLLRSKVIKVNGRDLFYMIGTAKREIKGERKEFMMFKVFTVFPDRKLWVAKTLTVSNEKMDALVEVAEKLLDSFALVDPKSVEKAMNQLGLGETPAPTTKGR